MKPETFEHPGGSREVSAVTRPNVDWITGYTENRFCWGFLTSDDKCWEKYPE
jgi:hypothetical protein